MKPMTLNRSKSKATGVVLLEVLISVMIMGVALGVVFRSLSNSTRLQSALEDRAVARSLGASQLAQLRLSPAALSQGEQGGKFEAPFTEYSWSASAQPPRDESPFLRVRLDVWQGKDKRNVYRIETLFAQQ